jgi:hypothetical protein
MSAPKKTAVFRDWLRAAPIGNDPEEEAVPVVLTLDVATWVCVLEAAFTNDTTIDE